MASDAFLHAGRRRKVAVTGLVAGVVAGIVFAMFEMIVAALQGMGFFAPLRMIAAIVLGEKTMDTSFSLAGAIAAGAIVHMILSAVYGVVLALLVAVWPLLQKPLPLVIAAMIYGFALWIVNFFVIAPVTFPWFGMADHLVQFVAHAFAFGSVLGVLLVWHLPRGVTR